MLHPHRYNNLKIAHPALQRSRLGGCAALALLFAFINTPSMSHAKNGGWDLEPYHVQIDIAIDAPGGLTERLADQLPTYLQRRISVSLAPIWVSDVRITSGQDRAKVFAAITDVDPPPPDFPPNKDKLLIVTVRTGPTGIVLAAREFDRYVQRWSAPLRRESQQESYLPEQLFSLVIKTFSPLAQLELDPKNPRHITLKPRAASLPRSAGAGPSIKVGDVFAPVLRRTTRGGDLEKKGGIQNVPWTFIEATEVKDNTATGRFQSANRHPLIARRQGRVEPVAIAVHTDPDAFTLRLHSRTAADKPLVGYEVFTQEPGGETPTRVGATDTSGQISIPPGESPLQFLLVKHGGQLFAKVPVIAGEKSLIDIPLPDDDARLAAEASMASVREDLVDVVARRNILMSRARQKIEKKDYAAAQELLRALDDLPSRPQFNLTLTNAARSLRTGDPQMQKRIDRLIESTQALLTQYLDVRPISKLHDDLRKAQSKGTKSGTAGGTSKG